MVRRARLLAPFALAALSAVAALSLGRVVDSSRYVIPVLAAALLPHLLGALVRWRGWRAWSGAVLAVLGLAVFVVVAVELSGSTAGIPGGDTWRAFEDQITNGWHLLRTATAPAPTTDGAVLLASIAVWAMAAFADWLAFARHTALAAISPALVFFVWTSALGTADGRIALTVAFCLAAGAFLLAQNLAVLDLRRSWLVSQNAARGRGLTPAAVLGGGAIVFALVLAPIIPGAGSDPLLNIASTGRDNSAGRSYRPSLAPFVDIGRKLDATANTELFAVRSELPDYWRIAALDQYSGDNGGQWTLSAAGTDNVGVGLPETPPAGSLVQEFAIGPLSERWLPAAYRPVAIDLPDTLIVRSSDTIVAAAPRVSNLRYSVASQLPTLAGTPLSAAQVAATAAAVPADLRPYLALPKSSDIDQIHRIASGIVNAAGASTPYDKARALNEYFRSTAFQYDTSVGTLDNGSAILEFLTNKRGFCVQFASAYAVMARSLGIPARVAVGFTPGSRGADGRYHVSSHDAHAWPEIYLNGLGWTHLFDPTPGQSGVTTGGSNLPHDTASVATPTTVPPPTTAAPKPGTGAAGGTGRPEPAPPVTPTFAPRPATSHHDPLRPWLVVLVVLALVALAGAAYCFGVLAMKRRRRDRRHDAHDPTAAVLGAWAETIDRLHDATVDPDPAQTALELATSAPAVTSAATAAPLRQLADAYSAARYGVGVIEPDDARAAWTCVTALEAALDDGASWSRRWRRRLDPSTLVRR
jgi:transglutaminase-like putative cysteine protease